MSAQRGAASKTRHERARVVRAGFVAAIAIFASVGSVVIQPAWPLAGAVFAREAPGGQAGAAAWAGDTIARARLPREARDTLNLIAAGGPYLYAKDGVVFGNFERLLPRSARGYYHEYTVPTPNARNRGARRIVCGGPPRRTDPCFYSDDHYSSFKRIVE
jgi:ribonuclease T1